MGYRNVEDFIRALNFTHEESKMNKNLIKKCKQTEERMKKASYEIMRNEKIFIECSKDISNDLYNLSQFAKGPRDAVKNAIKRTKDHPYLNLKNKEIFH